MKTLPAVQLSRITYDYAAICSLYGFLHSLYHKQLHHLHQNLHLFNMQISTLFRIMFFLISIGNLLAPVKTFGYYFGQSNSEVQELKKKYPGQENHITKRSPVPEPSSSQTSQQNAFIAYNSNTDSHDTSSTAVDLHPQVSKSQTIQPACGACKCTCQSENFGLWFIDFVVITYISIEFLRRIILAIKSALGKKKSKEEEADHLKSQQMLANMNTMMANFFAQVPSAAATAPAFPTTNQNAAIPFQELISKSQPITLKPY